MAFIDASLPGVPVERLPDVLTNELPAAELNALRLDATLVPFANAFLVADALGDAADRIHGAFGRHSSRLIAELDTAAWVWGARHSPPTQFEFCASLTERARLFTARHLGTQANFKDVSLAFAKRGIKKKKVTTVKQNPRLYPDDVVTAYLSAMRRRLVEVDEGGYEIFCVDECHFRATDH